MWCDQILMAKPPIAYTAQLYNTQPTHDTPTHRLLTYAWCYNLSTPNRHIIHHCIGSPSMRTIVSLYLLVKPWDTTIQWCILTTYGNYRLLQLLADTRQLNLEKLFKITWHFTSQWCILTLNETSHNLNFFPLNQVFEKYKRASSRMLYVLHMYTLFLDQTLKGKHTKKWLRYFGSKWLDISPHIKKILWLNKQEKEREIYREI